LLIDFGLDGVHQGLNARSMIENELFMTD